MRSRLLMSDIRWSTGAAIEDGRGASEPGGGGAGSRRVFVDSCFIHGISGVGRSRAGRNGLRVAVDYAAGAGYDMVTGIGTIEVKNLLTLPAPATTSTTTSTSTTTTTKP